jgi:hypothetical protein
MSFQEDSLKEAVKSASEIYKDNARISGLLDDKAQKAGALAGIFVAAAFGFIKTNEVNDFTIAYGRYSESLLIGSIILFIFCLGVCLSVMWVRGVPMPLGIVALKRLLSDLSGLSPDELTEQVRRNFYLDQLAIWTKILDLQSAFNRTKGRRLWLAQFLLGAGMLLVSALLVGVILRK